MLRLILASVLIVLATALVASAQDAPATQPAGKIREAAQQLQQRTTETIQQMKDEGLKPGTILAWIVVGSLAASVVGNLFRSPISRLSVLFDLFIGAIGAFVGGFIVHVFGIDFGWPPVSFSSEAALMAIIFSIVLVLVIGRFKNKVHRVTSASTGAETAKP